MNIHQLMIESLQLLALGMGAVFIILSVLIVIITLVAKILPEETAVVHASPPPATVNHDHIAAIAAAVQQYRTNR